ncbi:MAG: serine protease [Acidobacteria bacterium]|nr:serine protease [Acidobacteriota bacterium]
MAWNDRLTALNYVLAGLYPLSGDATRIVTESGIPPQFVRFKEKAIDTWFEVLHAANERGKVINVIQTALKEYPDNPVLIQAEKGEITQLKAPAIGTDLPWKGGLSLDTIEKIMGKQSTLLPVSFLEIGIQRARSVARVHLSSGFGTGFLTKDNLLITNNHIISNSDQAVEAQIEFNYQQAVSGLDVEYVTFHLDPDKGFKTSVEDDWTFVRVREDANADWGAIEIEEVDISKTERVNIIQHPSGGPKQIALYHNVVVYADDSRVQYLTDTLPGSSGSPVFDSQWRIVALHHSGGWILEPHSKNHVFRNEGININKLVEVLEREDF